MKKIITENVNSGVTLHKFMEHKFNTLTMKLFFIRHLDEKATLASLLSKVLKRGTINNHSSKDLKKAFEDNYGSTFRVNVKKIGENHLFEVSLYMPDKKIIGDIAGNDAFRKSVNLLSEIIFSPYMEDGLLSNKYVEQEKRSLAQEIESIFNDKEQFALQRCIELTCENESYKIPSKGRLKDIEIIDNHCLTNFYKDLLRTSQIEMFIAGDFSNSDIEIINEKILSKFAPRNEHKCVDQEIKDISKIRIIEEFSNVKQGKFVMSLRSKVNPCSTLMPAFILYNGILGGGTYSKLFNIIREKNSLAYYVHSLADRNKQIMFIEAGINKDNFNKTKDLIDVILEDMKNGLISDQEMSQAKESTINSLWTLDDSSGGNINYYLMGLLCGCPIIPSDMENNIKEVTKEDIIKVANMIQTDLIFFLSSESEGENDDSRNQ
jgi:predicted Zn-dependent peptidase